MPIALAFDPLIGLRFTVAEWKRRSSDLEAYHSYRATEIGHQWFRIAVGT